MAAERIDLLTCSKRLRRTNMQFMVWRKINLPPTSSAPSSRMSLVKLEICSVNEDKFPPTWPSDWPSPEPSPPSHDDIFPGLISNILKWAAFEKTKNYCSYTDVAFILIIL